MKIKIDKVYKRRRRHLRVRRKVVGTPDRPRLCVFRSHRHIYAQIIDDSNGRTLASASSLKLEKMEPEEDASKMMNQACVVGKTIAGLAKEKGITKVAFDRGGYLYHGRVAALANAARKEGLEF